jgi:quercetin dioxygenase-like cupin family protein
MEGGKYTNPAKSANFRSAARVWHTGGRQNIKGQGGKPMNTELKLALTLLAGVAMGAVGMQTLQAEPEIARNVLQHADLTGTTTTEVYMTEITAQPGTVFQRHVHHGDEFTYVLQGSAEVDIAGEGAKTYKAGDTIHVTRETVHGGKVTSDGPLKLLAVHIVDKGKPLADPVK